MVRVSLISVWRIEALAAITLGVNVSVWKVWGAGCSICHYGWGAVGGYILREKVIGKCFFLTSFKSYIAL